MNCAIFLISPAIYDKIHIRLALFCTARLSVIRLLTSLFNPYNAFLRQSRRAVCFGLNDGLIKQKIYQAYIQNAVIIIPRFPNIIPDDDLGKQISGQTEWFQFSGLFFGIWHTSNQ